jgi:hypothetical protein
MHRLHEARIDHAPHIKQMCDGANKDPTIPFG